MLRDRRAGESLSTTDHPEMVKARRHRQTFDSLEAFSVPEVHRDYEVLRFLHGAILHHAGGLIRFKQDVPRLIRRAIDEVIDAPRSRRYTINELEKTEKTYIGTKIEILLRNHLELDPGSVLDLNIDGVEVDVKNTIRVTWTIPNEALGHPCILIGANESTSLCQFGLIVVREDLLNAGRNRDQKATIRKEELRLAHWILKDYPYPSNFWQHMDAQIRREVTSPRSGNRRVAALFTLHQRQVISRSTIEDLAQQKDYMKRIRRNGGARDSLALRQVAILSGKKHAELIASLNLPYCAKDQFVAITPENEREAELLVRAGEISPLV